MNALFHHVHGLLWSSTSQKETNLNPNLNPNLNLNLNPTREPLNAARLGL